MNFQKPMLTSFFAVALVSAATTFANSASEVIESPQEVERWYVALGGVDKAEFNKLISDNAMIELKDLGVTQTKQEFIAALDEWAAATKDASLVYRYQSIEAAKAVVKVCYRFKNNETLIIETFTFANKQITGSVQEQKGEDCGDM